MYTYIDRYEMIYGMISWVYDKNVKDGKYVQYFIYNILVSCVFKSGQMSIQLDSARGVQIQNESEAKLEGSHRNWVSQHCSARTPAISL